MFFFLRALFRKMYFFEVVWFYLAQYLSNQIKIFSDSSMRFLFLIKNIFLITTIAMITEKLCFSYFDDNYCQGDKFLHQIMQLIQSKLSLKNGVKEIKEKPVYSSQKQSSLEKLSQKCILRLITKVTDPSNRVKHVSIFCCC